MVLYNIYLLSLYICSHNTNGKLKYNCMCLGMQGKVIRPILHDKKHFGLSIARKKNYVFNNYSYY